MVIFSRSLEKNVRYSVVISDGDRSAYNALCNMNNDEGPYGDVKIEKRQVHKACSKEIRNSKKSSHKIKRKQNRGSGKNEYGRERETD